MATTDIHFVCGALQPCKRGVRFLATNTDDGIQVNAAGAAMANVSTQGTISAWIMIPDQTGTYCIFGAGDGNVAEYIHFSVEAGKLFAACMDNTTMQWDINSTNVVIKPHVWHHVAIVQDGQRPVLYVDGEAVAMSDTTTTALGSWFKACAGIDGAHIGAADSIAGDGALTLEFKGYISKVKIWAGTTSSAALTASQIKDDYNGVINTTSLHNSWDLEYDLLDDGSGADNGTAVGDIIFSDANEFSSRLSFLETTPLAADNVSIMADKGIGYAYSILAA